ncbi:MAG: hypothetical protein M0R41_08205 [Methylobacter tundripaludum]|nr:hypothetical protein [Methylobacter tundripaludum]
MKGKWNNSLPDWLNVLLICCIVGVFLFGCVPYFDGVKQGNSTFTNAPFVPAEVLAATYFIILFITNLFASADLSSIMMVTLLAIGLILAGVGFYSKSEHDKSTFFEFSVAIIGLALGIPFGEKLRKESAISDAANPQKSLQESKDKT